MALKGIDISNWQAGINLAAVAPNVDFVIVKATEGIGFVDKQCDKFFQEAKRLGKKLGFYHFARTNNAVAEADFFYRNTKNYFGQAIPILDWEVDDSVVWVNEFVNRIHELSGVWCWVYANPWRFNQGTVNLNCGRWIAGYPYAITDVAYGIKNPMPSSYKPKNGLVCAWQFTSSCRIAGYNGTLDANVFYGDAAAWDAYCGSSSSSKPSAPSVSGSTLGLALAVMEGKYGNGDARKSALGDRYQEVQDFINHIASASNAELAAEVKQGKYGNGSDRMKILGGRYDAVQAIVNGSTKSIDELAREVIAGKWGNDPQRTKKLTAAGYDAAAVQARVNELL